MHKSNKPNLILLVLLGKFNKKNLYCQLRDSNPRPFGTAPKAAALDHSAKLTYLYFRKIQLKSPLHQNAIKFYPKK